MLDLEKQSATELVNWNTPDIDWTGASAGRGLRGIAFDGDIAYVAAGDALCAFTPDFNGMESYRCAYLKHCHGIAIWERTLYLASSAFDSIIGFDLDRKKFHWAMLVQSRNFQFKGTRYDPMSGDGPLPINKLHLNTVHCDRNGMYLTGLRTGGMLHFNGTKVNMAVQLPANARDARPFRDGVLFNDTDASVLRYTGRGEGEEDRAMHMPETDVATLQHADAIREGRVRSAFARGLCVISEHIVAGGSSPATVSIYDLAANESLGSVTLSLDVRNTIHSIALWPYD